MKFPDRLITKFELVKQLPSNKPFDVFLVKDKTKDLRPCVLRLLPASLSGDKAIVDTFMAYFSKFSEIINRAYIPTVYSVSGQVGGNVYVLEEHVSGIDLRKFVQKHRDNPGFNKEIISVIGKVCEALHHAHQKDLFHLAITPEDILIDEMTGRVKLFGFGTQIFSQLNKMGILSAQARKTIAPEILTGSSFKPYADVYSLAKAINEACPDIFFKTSVLTRALANNPLARHLSARDFQSALNKLLQGIQKIPVGKPKETPLESKGGLKPVLEKKPIRKGGAPTGQPPPGREIAYESESVRKEDLNPTEGSPKLASRGSKIKIGGIVAGLFMLLIGLTAYMYHQKQSFEKDAALNVNPANTISPKPSGLLDPVPAKLKWKVEIKNRFHPRMFLFNESLLIVNTTDGMVAVNTADGTIKWQSHDANPCAQDKGLIYYDGPRNQVCCMNPANQQVLRCVDLGDFQKIFVKNSTVVTQSHPDNICVFDANSGQKKWSVRGDDYPWEPSIDNNIIYFASTYNNFFEGLDLQTGKRNWFFKPNRNIAKNFEVIDGVLYFCFWEDMIGFVSAIDMDKKVKWKTPVNKSTDDYHEDAWFHHKPIIVDDTVLILVDIDAKLNGRYKSLIAIDRNTGDILWRSNVSMRSEPIVADRTVYFISGRGLIALDLQTGIEKWTFQSDDLRLGVYDALILASNDGTLYVSDSVCLYSIHTR